MLGVAVMQLLGSYSWDGGADGADTDGWCHTLDTGCCVGGIEGMLRPAWKLICVGVGVGAGKPWFIGL
jgi:hypothetical protein